MKILKVVFYSLCVVFLAGKAFAAEIDESTIARRIAESDESEVSLVAKYQITSYRQDKQDSSMVLEIFSKGKTQSIARYLRPQVDRGKIVLMRGCAYWFYFPNTKSAIKISAKQRLLGQAYVSDIIKPPLMQLYRMSYIGSVNENGDNLYEYEMIATSRDAPYDKLKVRYSERYGSIVYQEFYTNTGIMLKRAYYEDIVNKDGNTFAKKIRIEDANQKGTSTIVEMLDIKIQDLNDKIFRIEALESLPFVYD